MDSSIKTLEERIDELLFSYRTCSKCSLCKNRNTLLYGKGRTSTHVVAVLDRVGPRAASTGNILTGGEGRFLTTLFKRAGMDPSAIWITPVVSCPTGTTLPQQNRRVEMLPAPKKSEVEACSPRLHEEIHNIEPCMIFAFGSASVSSLVPNAKFQELQGRVTEAFITGDLVEYPVPMMALPSMNQLYRNPAQKPGSIWNKTLESIKAGLAVAHKLNGLRRNDG